MGSIIGRTRKDGTTAYLAQILLKSKGKIVHRESQTFDRKQAAKAWLARRETELSEPGGFDRSKDVKLADVFDRYVRESEREIGRIKAQVLAKIKEFEIADLPCSEIRSQHLTEFARSLNVQPQKPLLPKLSPRPIKALVLGARCGSPKPGLRSDGANF